MNETRLERIDKYTFISLMLVYFYDVFSSAALLLEKRYVRNILNSFADSLDWHSYYNRIFYQRKWCHNMWMDNDSYIFGGAYDTYFNKFIFIFICTYFSIIFVVTWIFKCKTHKDKQHLHKYSNNNSLLAIYKFSR